MQLSTHNCVFWVQQDVGLPLATIAAKTVTCTVPNHGVDRIGYLSYQKKAAGKKHAYLMVNLLIMQHTFQTATTRK